MVSAASTSSAPLPPTSFAPRGPSKSSSASTSKSSRSIDLANLTPNNIGQLRKLNSVLLPVRYSESFYKEVLKEERKNVCKLALFNDLPVGNICCRFEIPPTPSSSSGDPPPVRVYIMTLGVLAPYRRLGLASKMIKHLLVFAGPGTEIDLPDEEAEKALQEAEAAKAKKDAKKGSSTTAAGQSEAEKKKNSAPRPTKKYLVESVYLHVQTTNEEAREFYAKQGFTEGEVVEEYYRKGVEPRSAIVLERR